MENQTTSEVKKKETPAKEISFKVLDNNYTVKYPNTGQMLQIESMKSTLTGDSYGSFMRAETTAAAIAQLTTDMIAFFTVACPQLRKDLKVDTFSELEALDNKALLKTYVKTIRPWLTEWEQILNSLDDEE